VDCRWENVVDPKAPPPSGTDKAKTLPLAIIMNKGDRFFCSKDTPLSPVGWVEQEANKAPVTDPNAPQDPNAGSIPFFDM